MLNKFKDLTLICCIVCLLSNISIIACETPSHEEPVSEEVVTFFFLNAVGHPDIEYVRKVLQERRLGCIDI
jgi:predicted adenine nucleotide alpha hydrolase (AANH) superfamily ATPase